MKGCVLRVPSCDLEDGSKDGQLCELGHGVKKDERVKEVRERKVKSEGRKVGAGAGEGVCGERKREGGRGRRAEMEREEEEKRKTKARKGRKKERKTSVVSVPD